MILVWSGKGGGRASEFFLFFGGGFGIGLIERMRGLGGLYFL